MAQQVSTIVPVIILSAPTPRGKQHAVGIRILFCVSSGKIFGAVQTLPPSVQLTKLVAMQDSAPAMAGILQPNALTWNVVALALAAATGTHGGGLAQVAVCRRTVRRDTRAF